MRSIEVGDDVVLTELAYEKANKLGMELAKASVSTPTVSHVVKTVAPCACQGEQAKPAGDLHGRIRDAVNAKLGGSIDPQLLDVIIARVLKATGAN
ncbi:MAG TPA: hypothetical protein VMF29_06685 [Candidatus Edwardsbacteria bacterium]|nr:hypothetical protein [Candidatus Edwardsbacteria bacterium]